MHFKALEMRLIKTILKRQYNSDKHEVISAGFEVHVKGNGVLHQCVALFDFYQSNCLEDEHFIFGNQMVFA